MPIKSRTGIVLVRTHSILRLLCVTRKLTDSSETLSRILKSTADAIPPFFIRVGRPLEAGMDLQQGVMVSQQSNNRR